MNIDRQDNMIQDSHYDTGFEIEHTNSDDNHTPNNDDDGDDKINSTCSERDMSTNGQVTCRSIPYLKLPDTPDSDYRSSDRSPLNDENENRTRNCDSDKRHMTRSGDSGHHSETFFYRGKNETLTAGITWPLAEGQGWTPETSNEHAALTHSHKSNYSSTSRDYSGSTRRVIHQREATPPVDDEEEKPFKFSLLTRNQKIILASTNITNLLSFLSLSILAPFFPLEAEKKDVNNTISGWIFGVFSLTQFLTSPLFGRILPIVGSKFMYLSGLFVCGGCTLCFGVLDKVDVSDGTLVFILMSFITRVLLALGCTAVSNAGFVMVVRAFPDHVATVFGIGEIFTGVGMVTGPALGGFLYDAGGFILPFSIIGACCLVALPVLWLAIPPQNDFQITDGEDMSLWKVIKNPKSLVNSLVVVIAASIWAVLDPTLEPHLRVYGLSPSLVGVLFLIMAAFYSISSPVWGYLCERLPDNRALLIPGFLVAAVGLLLIGPSPALGFQLSYNELWLTIVALLILGVASAMVVIPTYDIYIDVLGEVGYPEDTRTYGMVSGLWVSMYALGDFAGPSIGGFLFEEIGFEWLTTWFAAACCLTSVIVAVSWYIEHKCCRRPHNEETIPIISATSMDSGAIDTCPSPNKIQYSSM